MLIGKIKRLDCSNNEDNNEKILHPGSIKSNFIDTEIFESALEDASRVSTVINERDEEQPFFKKLSEDIFHSLYKARPELYDKKDVYNSLDMEHDLLTDLINNDKFEVLRSNTAGDIFNSTLSLNSFQEKAYSKIQEWVDKSKENQDLMNKMNEAINGQNDLQKMIDSLKHDPENQSIKDQIEKSKEHLKKLNEISGNPSSVASLKQDIENVLEDVSKDVKDASDALNSFGMGAGDNDGNPKTTPYDQKKALVDALSNSTKLKEVSDQLGRIKESVNKVGKKPSKHGHSVCDIGSGNSIKRSLSTEKVKLIDKDLENDFYKRYMDKTLLEYKTQGTSDHKGPLVVCLDNSGSMGGNRDTWAKAVAVAMLQMSIKNKRDYRCIFFASKVVKIIDFFKGDKDNLTKIIDLAEFWNGGGTNFHLPLAAALESIENSKFKKADILFVTDGSPSNVLPDDFKKRFLRIKETKGFKVQSILIDGSNTAYLKEFSDDILTLKDLNNNNELVDIFNNMQNVN